VEQEHSQHLRDVRRIEQQTASFANGASNGSSFNLAPIGDAEMDFEALVKGQNSTPNPMSQPVMPSAADPWDDDSWANGDSSSSFVSLSKECQCYVS
jgi:SCY1-like protein 2